MIDLRSFLIYPEDWPVLAGLWLEWASDFWMDSWGM